MPADAAYMRNYRDRNPAALAAQKLRQKAHRAAMTALRHRHQAEFGMLLDLERALLGLPPAGTLKPGPRRKDHAA